MHAWGDGRAVEGEALEKPRRESARGFESLSPRFLIARAVLCSKEVMFAIFSLARCCSIIGLVDAKVAELVDAPDLGSGVLVA